MLTICTRICTCKPAILCMCRRAGSRKSAGMFRQRAELVYESIAVLDLVLEERSGSVHFASAKSGRFPKVLPELTDCSTPMSNETDRELAHECFPTRANLRLRCSAATACGRRVWRGVGGDDAGGGVFARYESHFKVLLRRGRYDPLSRPSPEPHGFHPTGHYEKS